LSYGLTWGQFKSITFPVVGNHEYLTAAAAGYFQYFGSAAGKSNQGYYSFDIGAWHLIALNAECSNVGGCQVGSPQETWLKADLAAHSNTCTLAYWHQPRFSSGKAGNWTQYSTFWQDLYAANADVVLGGHDHDYERFAPQNPSHQADPAQGIREFVVGTGGADHGGAGGFPSIQPNSQVRDNTTFGVLKLTLHPTSYSWAFVPEAGQTFTDSGTTNCH
jgi:acid phosphatase type 7